MIDRCSCFDCGDGLTGACVCEAPSDCILEVDIAYCLQSHFNTTLRKQVSLHGVLGGRIGLIMVCGRANKSCISNFWFFSFHFYLNQISVLKT